MKKQILLTTSLIVLLISGCTVSSTVTDNVSYVDQSFNFEAVESGGMSLLPIVAGSGVEGYRRPFGEQMNTVADSIITNFMGWNETLKVLNDSGLVSDYNSAIQSYQQTGIIDQNILNEMANATGKNYFLFVSLGTPAYEKDVSYDYVFGGVNTTETQSVSAFGLVWSAQDGDVVWEGTASAEVVTGDYSYTEETDMDRANKVASALMKSVFK